MHEFVQSNECEGDIAEFSLDCSGPELPSVKCYMQSDRLAHMVSCHEAMFGGVPGTLTIRFEPRVVDKLKR
jgi:hypothetical protein